MRSECPICYKVCSLKKTSCGHFFCDSCLNKLTSCALCRTVFKHIPLIDTVHFSHNSLYISSHERKRIEHQEKLNRRKQRLERKHTPHHSNRIATPHSQTDSFQTDSFQTDFYYDIPIDINNTSQPNLNVSDLISHHDFNSFHHFFQHISHFNSHYDNEDYYYDDSHYEDYYDDMETNWYEDHFDKFNMRV